MTPETAEKLAAFGERMKAVYSNKMDLGAISGVVNGYTISITRLSVSTTVRYEIRESASWRLLRAGIKSNCYDIDEFMNTLRCEVEVELRELKG